MSAPVSRRHRVILPATLKVATSGVGVTVEFGDLDITFICRDVYLGNLPFQLKKPNGRVLWRDRLLVTVFV